MARSTWPDIVFADEAPRASLSRAAAAGRLRRIARGIYSPSTDSPEAVVRRHFHRIVAHEASGAVIVDRSARSGRPDDAGRLFVDHPRDRPRRLPGLEIVPRHGPGRLPGDIALPDGIYLSSPARGLLDNLSGRRGDRLLSPAEVEAWIADLAIHLGAARLNEIRDHAREIALATDRDRALRRLSDLISAALATGPADVATTSVLRARAAGQAFDPARLESFEAAVAHLIDQTPAPLPELAVDPGRRRLLPFYEAYFSNFIEGTEFTLDEAAAIVFEGSVPPERPADAHDVLGTYRLVADDAEMSRVPATSDTLLDLLRARHATIMDARPDQRPGQFKIRPNRAGGTVFVVPELVEGTLRAGFEIGRRLRDPFARAAFMMFLISEVHPFADGNGRVARVMVNAELVAAREVRIIVPTAFRGEYVSALRAASNHRVFQALSAVLDFARRWTAQVDFSSRARAERDLERTNALVAPDVADAANLRLLLPSALDRIR